HDHEVFVTGRLKDLIIIRGLNHYPQDIELTVEQAHPKLRGGSGAACSVAVEGEERLVVVQEADHRRPSDWQAVSEAVVQAVAERHELQLHALVLVKTGSLPKTSSGKIQRHLCRSQFLNDELKTVFEWRATPQPAAGVSQRQNALQSLEGAGDIETWLRATLAERLGVEPSVFEVDRPLSRYGIDSLQAVELAHSVELMTGVSLSSVSFLQDVSIAELAAHIQARLEEPPTGEAAEPVQPIEAGAAEHAPSFGQQALWFLQQLEPASAAYNISRALRLRAHLDVAALRRAFQESVNRHPALRTVFLGNSQHLVCHVAKDASVSFQEDDASTWSEAFLAERLSEEARQPFNLEQGPLLRVSVFTRSAQEHVLLLTVHHIVADFWSLGLLMKEVASLYEAELAGSEAMLAPLSVEYADYTRWQARMLQSSEGERLWSYWRQQLSGELPALDLPTDKSRPPAQTFQGTSHDFKLSRELTRKLKALGQEHGATLYMTLLAGFQVLLHHYTGQEDILVGSPVAGRNQSDFKKLVGYFVNPVVLRADLSGRPRFTTFLDQVRQTALAAFAHQDFPFPLLVERLQPDRDLSRSPLFQVMFVMQNTQAFNDARLAAFALDAPGAAVTLGGLNFESLPLEQRIAQFDLTLIMAEAGDELRASFEYSTELFEADTIERMAGHLEQLLTSIVDAPEQPVADYSLLTPQERRQLLVQWNDTQTAWPEETCIHKLFEVQARKTPEAVAVVYGTERVTYAELNRRADQVAQQLRAAGVGPEVKAGICIGRNPDLIVGLLAILKAGGAYVPLDPTYPEQRLAFMLEDSQAPVLLTSLELSQSLPASGAKVICLDALPLEVNLEPTPGTMRRATPDNLAYVIYTSGSTGRPKGVAIQHRNAVAFLHWAHSLFTPQQLSAVLASTSICFDLSVFEVFAPLSCGGSLVLVEDVLALASDAAPAADLVTLVNTVPSALAELLRLDALPSSVEVVNLAGEALAGALAQQVYQRPHVRLLYNLYGPSEDTTYSTFQLVRAGEGQAPPIGRPIANTQAYILSPQLQPVPVGVRGELYLGGAGVARGYLNRPELTAERFIPDPFCTSDGNGSNGNSGGGRMYRTGDWARYQANGEIEFLGRLDQQVKVRGYRIELGEIEEVLRRHEAVREAVVMVRSLAGGGNEQLVCYVVAEDGAVIDSEQLQRYAEERLPGYMVPVGWREVEQMPLTANGKIDRRALSGAEVERRREYVAARSETEARIAEIWAEVLGVERVGVEESFFELGGHSLLATQAVSRMREVLGVEVALRWMFESPTVARLAVRIEAALETEHESAASQISRVSREAELPMSFGQERLWFLHQLETQSSAYNMSAIVRLKGALDVRTLERSLNELIRRHESLRTQFVSLNGNSLQVIVPPAPHTLAQEDLRGLGESEKEAELARIAADETQHNFDLAVAPLLRSLLLRLDEDEHALLLTTHHIIWDGWSTGIFLRELAVVYEAFRRGEPSPLEELPIQYADFAVWQRAWAQGGALQEQLDYWKKQLADAPPVIELPTDHPRAAMQTYRSGRHTFVLSRELSEGLKALGMSEQSSTFMTLLAGLHAFLYRYTQQQTIVVGTPVANRNQKALEALIGFFVNTLVMRADLSDTMRFRELLAQVRETALDAYAHQDLPFEKLVEELQPARSLSHTPLFQVMLVLQHAATTPDGLADLAFNLMPNGGATAKFDLLFNFIESEQGLAGELEYNQDLFDSVTAARMAEHFQTLLAGAVANPDQQLSALPLMTGAEQEQILVEWNPSPTAYPDSMCMHHLVEAQVALTPDAVALVCGEEQTTYADLNRRANQLARHLRQLGVGPEVRVGICVERTPEMIVGLLAILKAGGAYVPLDPTYPEQRLAFMLEDTRAPVLLTQHKLIESLPAHQAEVVCVDTDWPQIASHSTENLTQPVTPDNLAYVIYTSGSTGRPKGVAIQHRNAVAFLHWAHSLFTPQQLSA
ncbi:MAG TPA: amino acid adenylation domain-containing protein, partial [Pyrinomonadaceae bacterium]|nr:amino acid adenylation domain-containing protein [Pyrinomonadaceae bacterium]